MDRESILVPGVALPVPLAYAIAEEFLAAPSLLAIGTLIVFAARRSAQAAARFPVAHQGVWGGGCGVLRLSARGLPGGHCSSTAAAHDVVCGWPRPALVVPGVVDGGIGLHALESGVCALCTGLIPSAVIDASAHTPICDPSVRLDRWRWRWWWWWWWRWSCRSGSLWLRLLWWWWWLCGSSWLGGDHGLLLWGGSHWRCWRRRPDHGSVRGNHADVSAVEEHFWSGRQRGPAAVHGPRAVPQILDPPRVGGKVVSVVPSRVARVCSDVGPLQGAVLARDVLGNLEAHPEGHPRCESRRDRGHLLVDVGRRGHVSPIGVHGIAVGAVDRIRHEGERVPVEASLRRVSPVLAESELHVATVMGGEGELKVVGLARHVLLRHGRSEWPPARVLGVVVVPSAVRLGGAANASPVHRVGVVLGRPRPARPPSLGVLPCEERTSLWLGHQAVAVGLEERRRDDDGDEEDSRVLHGVRGVIRDRGEGGGS